MNRFWRSFTPDVVGAWLIITFMCIFRLLRGKDVMSTLFGGVLDYALIMPTMVTINSWKAILAVTGILMAMLALIKIILF